MTNVADHYGVLGIARDSDATQIRAAYIRLVKTHHPDSRTREEFPLDRLRLLQQAYACLRDPVCRTAHDLALHAHDQEHGKRVRRVQRRLRSLERRGSPDAVLYRRWATSHWRPVLAIAIGATAIVSLATLLFA